LSVVDSAHCQQISRKLVVFLGRHIYQWIRSAPWLTCCLHLAASTSMPQAPDFQPTYCWSTLTSQMWCSGKSREHGSWWREHCGWSRKHRGQRMKADDSNGHVLCVDKHVELTNFRSKGIWTDENSRLAVPSDKEYLKCAWFTWGD
jgi:hypothetical protein